MAECVAATEVSPAPTAAEWEARWQAGLYMAIRDRVNPNAAAAYLPEDPAENDDAPRDSAS